MTDIKEGLLLWFTKFLIEKAGSGLNIEAKHNDKLAEELHKPIIRIF